MPWKKGNRIRLLAEADADGPTRETYEQLKQALGLPRVAALYQAFAVYPKFLQLHWEAFRPVFAANQFFALASRLRADAYTRAFNYFDVPDLSVAADESSMRELAEATDLLQYEDPALLLVAAVQLHAFDGPVGRVEEPVVPVTHPVFAKSPALAAEQLTPAPLRRVYDDLRLALGTSFVSYEYRTLARCPDFFTRYWTALKEWSASPMYEGIQHAIRESAWTLARETPHPVELTVSYLSDAGLSDEDIAAVMHISELFVNELSSLVLNVSLARIALEGGTRIHTPAAPVIVKQTTEAEKAA
jgi:hypothetical protein